MSDTISTETLERESLITEILGLTQTLLQKIDDMKPEIESIKEEIQNINRRIDSIIEEAFVDGDLKQHRHDHERQSFFQRLFK